MKKFPVIYYLSKLPFSLSKIAPFQVYPRSSHNPPPIVFRASPIRQHYLGEEGRGISIFQLPKRLQVVPNTDLRSAKCKLLSN